MKCTQSRCQREKAANANARRRTRGTRRRHAWRDKVHSAHLLLTDARSTAYLVGNTLYWFFILRSYFFGWESIFDASFRLNFAQTVRVNELTSFCHFIIVCGKQSRSDLSHVCFLWSKTLGTLETAQSLKCSHPSFPVQPRSQGFSYYGAAILVSNVPNLLKGGKGDGLPSPIAKYPGTTTSIHLKSRWQVGYPGCVLSLLRRDSSVSADTPSAMKRSHYEEWP